MSARKIKKQVLELLTGPNLEEILTQLREMPPKDTINVLFSAICRSEEVLRWHAISAMGIMVPMLAGEDMEEARIIMRRMLWSLNDESGGIGWGAPESMGEIMSRHEGLADEYIHMLISYMRPDGEELEQDGNFLEHETLQRGLLWGIARLGETRKDMLLEKGADADVLPYLSSSDGCVRGLAALVAGLLGVQAAKEQLRSMTGDDAPVRLYENAALGTVSVGKLAMQALQRMES